MIEVSEIVEKSVPIVKHMFFNKIYVNDLEIPQTEMKATFNKIQNAFLKLFHANAFDNFKFGELMFELKEFTDHNNWKAYQSFEGNILQNNYILCKDGFISFHSSDSGH